MIVTRKQKQANKRNETSDILQQLARPLAQWTGKQMVGAVRGIVSAYQQRNSGRQEMASAVAPLAQSLRKTGKAPRFTTVGGGVTITHVEALPITSNVMSTMISSDTFPWLASIASGFEEYKIKLEFGYVPICPATTTGSVMMAWDYDPSDVRIYTDYTDFFNTADHCVGAIWAPGAISPKESGWLKTGITGDVRLYSPGVFKMSVSSSNSGYLMARYTVQLRKAQPNDGNYAVYTGQFTSNALLTASPTLVAGSDGLVAVGSSGWTQKTPGRILGVWSTDANVTTFNAVGNMLVTGYAISATRSVATVYSDNPSNFITLTAGFTPGGATSYKLAVYRIPVSPVYS